MKEGRWLTGGLRVGAAEAARILIDSSSKVVSIAT